MIDLDELERLEREAAPAPWKTSLTKVASGEWEYQLIAERGHAAKPYSDFSLIVAARNALPDLIAELRTLRARVAEIERDLDACRVELLEARHAVGEEWFDGEATLAEGVARKCQMLEDDAEHWRRAAEARSLRAEDGDHALHRFAALAAAKNEGRSAITLTVWSDGTVDAEQYATLDGELDEWGTLYQERRASWGSRPIGELDALVDDLESGDWYTVEHRAPQDFWGEIAVLRDEVERLRDDIDMACENTPWPGCECPGCETARGRAEAELNGGDR